MKQTPAAQEALYRRIRELIAAARQTVARGIDLVQVRTNFEIGRHIVEHEQQGEQRAAYGKAVVKLLADKLSREFGSGFSETSLKTMRQFYLLYAERIGQTASDVFLPPAIGQTLSDQSAISRQTSKSARPRPFSLSWSHYVFLLGIKNPDERSFYEIEAAGQNWTLRELKRQFDSGLYERLALSRDKEGIRKLAREGQIFVRRSFVMRHELAEWSKGVSEYLHLNSMPAGAA